MKRLIIPLLAAIGVILAANSSLAQPDSLWSIRFGSLHNDMATAVYELDNGAFLIGCNSGTNGENWDASLLMFSPSGDSLWGKVYHAPNDDFVKTILPWFYGGYMLCGWSRSFSTGYPQFYMLCVDGKGNELWTKAFGERECLSNSVVIDDNADYYFLGTINHAVEEGDLRNWDARIMKISARGDSLWTRDYGDKFHDEYTRAGIRTNDGGFALAGEISSSTPNEGTSDVLLMKFDRHANLEWSRTYGSDVDAEEGTGLVQTPDGGFVVGGSYRSYAHWDMEGFALKVSAQGDSLWYRTLGEERHDYIKSADLSLDGDVILTGASGYYGRNYDYKAVSLDYRTGEIIWEKTFGGRCWDFCLNSKVMSDGSLMMMGESQTFTCDPNHLINDSWVIRVGFPNSVPKTRDLAYSANDVAISSVVPNPFNARAIVSLELPLSGDYAVSLTDVSGRELRQWQGYGGGAGIRQIAVDGAGLSAGSYWMRLQQNDRVAMTKLILVK